MVRTFTRPSKQTSKPIHKVSKLWTFVAILAHRKRRHNKEHIYAQQTMILKMSVARHLLTCMQDLV